jgi:hypothetical protein
MPSFVMAMLIIIHLNHLYNFEVMTEKSTKKGGSHHSTRWEHIFVLMSTHDSQIAMSGTFWFTLCVHRAFLPGNAIIHVD